MELSNFTKCKLTLKWATRAVVPNQGCSHPPQVRNIIPGEARSVRCNDRKLMCLLFSCDYFAFVFNRIIGKNTNFVHSCTSRYYSRKHRGVVFKKGLGTPFPHFPTQLLPCFRLKPNSNTKYRSDALTRKKLL